MADDLYDVYLARLEDQGTDLMARTKFSDRRKDVEARAGAKERPARKRAETPEEIQLFELRHARAMSQAELAGRLDVTPGGISKLEHADDVRVSTLRQYLEGLGARLAGRGLRRRGTGRPHPSRYRGPGAGRVAGESCDVAQGPWNRGGRHAAGHGFGAVVVESVGLDPELTRDLLLRAADDGISVSEARALAADPTPSEPSDVRDPSVSAPEYRAGRAPSGIDPVQQ